MGAKPQKKAGEKTLPSVHLNAKGQPARDKGLQYMPHANSQARSNILLARVPSNPVILQPDQPQVHFDARNYDPQDLLNPIPNSKQMLSRGRNNAALQWASEAVLEGPGSTKYNNEFFEGANKKELSAMFSGIEDVQQIETEVEVNEDKNASGMGSGLTRNQSSMLQTGQGRMSVMQTQDNRKSTGALRQTGSAIEAKRPETLMRTIASDNRMVDDPIEPAFMHQKTKSQFLLRLPVPSVESGMRRENPGSQWVGEVGHQLTKFRKHQTSQMLPTVGQKGTQMQHIQEMETHQTFSNKHPQFSTLNCEPYQRDRLSNFGKTNESESLLDRQRMAAASKSVISLTGLQMRTPLGAAGHLHKQTVKRAAHAGQHPGSKPALIPSQSEAFLTGRERTKQLCDQINLNQDAESQFKKNKNFANKLRGQALDSRNQNSVHQVTGQTQMTEEVLRQHFFMAQATGRTLATDLKREKSPQKHLAQFKRRNITQTQETDKSSLKRKKSSMTTVIRLNRDDTLKTLQVQTASLMRLNAAWGLEKKPDPVDIHKLPMDPSADQEFVREEGVQYDTKLEQNQFFDDQVGRTALDQIITVLQSRINNDGYFLYLKPSDSADPYDLRPMVDYKTAQDDQGEIYQLVTGHTGKLQNSDPRLKGEYFTLSKKGITQYSKDEPVDYTSLADWLVERSFYREISVKGFFKNFRIWKQLRMWRRNILQKKRKEIQESISEKLFVIDKEFGPILQQHRVNCLQMMQLRVIDMSQKGIQTLTLQEFEQRQAETRKNTTEKIEDKSRKCREMFKSGIDQVLSKLQSRVNEQDNEDDAAQRDYAKQKPIEEQLQHQRPEHGIDKNPRFTALGFNVNLKYGMRKQLRKACTRFLKFSYLLDFYALETLSKIYLSSVEDTVSRLKYLAGMRVNYELKMEVADEFDQKEPKTEKKAAPVEQTSLLQQQLPFFSTNAHFQVEPIHKSRLYSVYIDEFKPVPLGQSTFDDFNPTCHLELEKEGEIENEGLFEPISYEEPEQEDPLKYKKEVQRVTDLNQLWMSIYPSGQDFAHSINDALLEGLECLMGYERWSRHPDLDKYEKVLESWDDRVCSEWVLPDKLHLNCDEWLSDNVMYKEKEATVNLYVEQAFSKVNLFFDQFEPILIAYRENEQTEYDILKDEKLMNPTEVLNALLYRFQNQRQLFETVLPVTRDIGMVKIDMKKVKEKIAPQPKDQLLKLKEILPPSITSRVEVINKWLEKQILTIKPPPQNVDQYVKQIQAIDYIDENFQKKKDKLELCHQLYNLCASADLVGKQEQSKRYLMTANSLVTQLTHQLREAREKSEKRRDEMIIKIKKKIPKLDTMTAEMLNELSDPKYLDIESNIHLINDQNQFNEQKTQQLLKKKSSIQEYQLTLDMGEICQFQDVEEARKNHVYRHKLWSALKDWQDYTDRWQVEPFEDIDIKQISQLSEQFTKISIQCERNLPAHSTAVKTLKKIVGDFRETMPIVEALGNPYLDKIHWDEVRIILNITEEFLLEERQFCLGDLIALDVSAKQEEIVHISVTATQEAKLYAQLEEVKLILLDMNFDVIKYGRRDDCYILNDIEKVVTTLDDQLTQLSNIQSSRYVKRYAKEVQEEQRKVDIASDTLEQWKKCQRAWVYLEKIFDSQDIKNSVKEESKEFSGIDRNWNKTMKKVFTNRSVMKNCVAKQNERKQLNDFLKDNEKMDRIEKSLQNYLEEKRTDFPRFYFISNDELLMLLAEQQNIEKVVRNLANLFEGIAYLDMENKSNDSIVSIRSPQMEVIQLTRAVKIRSDKGIESWLHALETQMVDTLKKGVKFARADIEKGNLYKNWVTEHAGQLISIVSHCIWTEYTETAIEAIESEDPDPYALDSHFKDWQEQLRKLVELIHGSALTILQRINLVALITQEVHGRDIIEKLNEQQVKSIYEFIWQQQLRYYQEEDGACVKQVNANLAYGYEYLGATTRIVVTPLTDRCWLTITGALHIKLGAQPAGPAGTGKTESTKDLAKALGVLCVVYNCNEQIHYSIMGRLFSGVAQSGSWICLDEFNRIGVEVLSVIAQQLQDIKQAKIANKERFIFIDKEIALRESCGVFVTMNPTYAGRTELPDNLKVLFRPVSMMIPSYGLIAKVMLYAEGFKDAANLSDKMVQLYQLASQQLSQQAHYDFGMRAVKSVLVMAGNLKRTNSKLNEDILLIRAMRDANIPKFLADDLPLFNALVQDLFPGVQIEEPTFVALENQITSSIDALQLRNLPNFQTKIIQLFDTFNVRFGVMLIGPTGAGKTECYRVLQDVMRHLEKQIPNDLRFASVETRIINPKSISMGELYGEENIDTKEWTDGLASKIIRKFAKKEKIEKDRHGLEIRKQFWTIFDGPVDAKWVENMNTVLDDSMLLSLPNGERIKLHTQMHMLFEVEDMKQASPATVSRLGMVYMTPSDLGWEPYVESWIQRYLRNDPGQSDVVQVKAAQVPQPLLEKEVIDYLKELFISLVRTAFDKMERVIAEEQALVCVPVQFVTNLCNFLEVFIFRDCVLTKRKSKAEWTKHLNCIFGYSFIWAFGANFKQGAIRFLDNMMRDFFSSLHIPENDTVFDYALEEKTLKWTHWNEKVKQQPFQYEVNAPFFKLVVPTMDTLRFSQLIDMLTPIDKPVFLTGITGTGKSMIVMNYINANREKKQLAPIILNFSAQTSSQETQKTIEERLMKKGTQQIGLPDAVKKKKRRLIGAKGNSKCFIFIDDINMPKQEEYGAQPPIELLRQLVELRGFYDKPPKFSWKQIEKFAFVAAAAPPGGGRQALTPRFMRQFHILNVSDPSEETLFKIFESILSSFMNVTKFTQEIRKQTEATVSATIDMYTQITANLLPIPSKFHYTFNLRDVAKVFQGILMSKPQSVADEDTYKKLWLHECSRVFGDRLCTEKDRSYFQDLCCELLGNKFKARWNKKEEIFGYQQEIIFSIITNVDSEPEMRHYMQVQKRSTLTKMLEEKLDDFNFNSESKMDLVFFEDAVKYINKITRILMQPRGNSMLIGVAGCGKQSLTRFSAFMLEQECFQLKLAKKFSQVDFQETLRDRLLKAGCDSTKTTFLLTDTQIMHESFLEDVNNLLNTGEITNLYTKEDNERIEEALGKVLSEKKMAQTPDNMYNEYIEQLRDNFHIILCMSPIGGTLRDRCLKFPSLISCCTLVWFDSWPEQALSEVATQFLGRMGPEELSNEAKQSLSKLFPMVHRSVDNAATQFFEELKRKTYVTPKSYLDAIQLYLAHLKETKNKHDKKVNTLKTGVNNLDQTKSQIADLQEYLKELQPSLEQQNKEADTKAADIKKNKQDMLEKEEEAYQEQKLMDDEAKKLNMNKRAADIELEKAVKPMNDAKSAVENLSKEAINELKKTNAPNSGVKKTLDVVLIYLGHNKIDWATAQKEMAKMDFLTRIQKYDKDKISNKIIQTVKPILSDEKNFDVNQIKNSSKAAGDMARWCKAIYLYDEAIKKVNPQRQKVFEMEQSYEKMRVQQEAKRAEVDQIKETLKQMESDLNETTKKIASLQQAKIQCEQRLINAQKLLDLLGEEGVRWQKSIEDMEMNSTNYTGNVFIAAASLSYLGPFLATYRNDLSAIWMEACQTEGIKVAGDYSLVNTLGDQIEIRNWGLAGLPTDDVSIESGIIVWKSSRWPLIIDPQMQANRWLKKMYKKSQVKNNITRFQQSEEVRIEEVNSSIVINNEAGYEKHTVQQQSIQIEQQELYTHQIGSNEVDDQFVVLQMNKKNEDKKGNDLTQKLLENAVMTGKTVLLEDVSQHLDPSLDSLFTKAIYSEDGIEKIKFGDNSVPYDRNFKLYLSTKLANPHFLPETCIKLAIVNFTVTQDGLEEQMLVDVVNNQAPEVEAKRDALVIEISASKNSLDELQAKILYELAMSDAKTILDNEELIETLEITRTKTTKIAKSLMEAEQINEVINHTRNQYRLVAQRGSILYFSIVDMSGIDSMYQNSLQYVQKLFNEAISGIKRADSTEGTVQLLIDAITKQLYSSICMGLFERHKLIYSFIICTSIKRHAKKIREGHWNLLLRGSGIFDKSNQPEKPKEVAHFISDAAWDIIYCLQVEHNVSSDSRTGIDSVDDKVGHMFTNFCSKIIKNAKKWEKYVANLQDNKTFFKEMPNDMANKLEPFEKLLIVKIFKPHRLMSAIQKYIKVELGKFYSISPISAFESLFKAADAQTPIIFVLSQGVDSSWQVRNFADRKQIKLHSTSLGQGQEKAAASLIKAGQDYGQWVMLQNCHLFKSWMSTLEQVCAELRDNSEEVHENFRLILTSMPTEAFPTSVLQSGLKMTTEPPRGVKANLQRSYSNIVTEDLYHLDQPDKTRTSNFLPSVTITSDFTKKEQACHKLIFSLCFFHAAIQERKKFGALGWNIRYEFSEADLDTSITMLRNFLQEDSDIPWDALKFMTGQITYGGRVTDDWDRILLMTMLDNYYNDNVLEAQKFNFSRSGLYYVPQHQSISEAKDYIETLPAREEPEVFGMHANADISFMESESMLILESVLAVQPKQKSKAKKQQEVNEDQSDVSEEEVSADQELLNLVQRLRRKIPLMIERESFAKEILKLNNRGLLHCHSTVLLQEVHRYNQLIECINNSLESLTKAVKGIVLMSPQLDLMQQSLTNNQVPTIWTKVAYPSLKPLASWVSDLCDRVDFMQKWAQKGHPSCFWLSGFFFPNGFMTGTLQTYARKRGKPIDTLKFSFTVLNKMDRNEVEEDPEDGVLIYGLFIQNAKWSRSNCCLVDSRPGQINSPMPIIHFLPIEMRKPGPSIAASPMKSVMSKETLPEVYSDEEDLPEVYNCPVYKTSTRAGELNTTGQSTNFILSVDLPCGYPENAITSKSSSKSKKPTEEEDYEDFNSRYWILRGTAMLTMLDM